nr:DUF4391 domain-containing protein [uncultured Pedobacter sp.]
MDYFSLPETTKVRRIIPKNTFDSYTNSQQKKLFSDKIARITWMQKISKETVNIPFNEISEIQIFKIELKVKEDIAAILAIIDKAIPYHIVFVVEYGDEIYISTSKKHPNPTNENNSVMDWTFKSDWFLATDSKYRLNLKQNIDTVFKNVCLQLLEREDLRNQPFKSIINIQQQIETLQKEIANLKSGISKCKQFNRKVELNLLLKKKELELTEWRQEN